MEKEAAEILKKLMENYNRIYQRAGEGMSELSHIDKLLRTKAEINILSE